MSTVVKSWKKVFISDLEYLVNEFKEELELPAVIFLEGDLGAGKTSFVQACSKKELLLSPTYSVLTESLDLLHGDFYRIKDAEEIYHLEMESYLEHKDYVFLEWGHKYKDHVDRIIPEDFHFYLINIETPETEGLNYRNYEFLKINRD